MTTRIKNFAKQWLKALIYPRPFVGILYLPRYLKHLFRYSRRQRIQLLDTHPCLGDWTAHTPFDAHYFYQAAWLARRLAVNPPNKHLDIGSDVKLMGTISAFMPTEFMDYRPLNATLPGLECTRGNLLGLPFSDGSISSLSCLHVVEHIGLGRYGDSIDPDGHSKALAELERVVASGGLLYLSVPVGQERVCFNAHRVFAPESILTMLPNMTLVSFSLVRDDGSYLPDCGINAAEGLDYGCGLFLMEKRGLFGHRSA